MTLYVIMSSNPRFFRTGGGINKELARIHQKAADRVKAR